MDKIELECEDCENTWFAARESLDKKEVPVCDECGGLMFQA